MVTDYIPVIQSVFWKPIEGTCTTDKENINSNLIHKENIELDFLFALLLYSQLV